MKNYLSYQNSFVACYDHSYPVDGSKGLLLILGKRQPLSLVEQLMFCVNEAERQIFILVLTPTETIY